MKIYTIEDLPKLNLKIARFGTGVFVMKISECEFYVCRKMKNVFQFQEAYKNIEKYNQNKPIEEQVIEFNNANDTIKYMNNMNLKQIKKELDKLPDRQKKEIVEQIKEQPNLLFGIQKSLKLGHSDLPLFASESASRQTNLF